MSRSVSLDLQQKLSPSLKQMQRLMMSQHMQQAIKLLQLPIMELTAAVEEELEQNPVLEQALDYDGDDPEISPLEQEHVDAIVEADGETAVEKALAFDEKDLLILHRLDEEFQDHFNESHPNYRTHSSEEEKWLNYQESLVQGPTSLFEHLMQQANEAFSQADDKAMAQALIGNFDERGFLQTSLEEVALLGNFSMHKLEAILKIIQTFEPIGVGAKDLRESLLIQMRAKNQSQTLAYAIIDGHFDSLLHNHIPQIQKALKCTEAAIKAALGQIAKLQMHPGSSCSPHQVQAIYPDVTIRQEEEELVVGVEDNFLPTFRFNRRYLRMLEDEQLPDETKEFIRKKILSANWLMRTIHQRNSTLERIAAFLAKRQRNFFLNPDGKLVPLTMKAVAEELELHESTIARTVANKYMDSPRGLLALRSFFTTSLSSNSGEGVSSHSVKDLMQEMIKKEDKTHPLSDDAIAARIQAKGIQCARRTVAKYRLLLKIGNAHMRRQY